LFSVISK